METRQGAGWFAGRPVMPGGACVCGARDKGVAHERVRAWRAGLAWPDGDNRIAFRKNR